MNTHHVYIPTWCMDIDGCTEGVTVMVLFLGALDMTVDGLKGEYPGGRPPAVLAGRPPVPPPPPVLAGLPPGVLAGLPEVPGCGTWRPLEWER